MILDEVLESKFTCNPSFAQMLADTEDATLVEASPYDKIWGAGVSVDDSRIIQPEKWPGLNLLGLAMERVREKIVDGDIEVAGLRNVSQSKPRLTFGVRPRP